MSKKIVNLTLPIVSEEIEDVLETYPEYPYQRAFSNTNLRQDLVAYVLSHVPNKYTVIEDVQLVSSNSSLLHCTSEQRMQIERWIHLGICDILSINYGVSYCHAM
ncbi:MAG: hypothetical protein F6K58_23050 [Symploca sp. SIO2E9]|nr:hypothetical protein [Symploca sp. SIO2E9]